MEFLNEQPFDFSEFCNMSPSPFPPMPSNLINWSPAAQGILGYQYSLKSFGDIEAGPSGLKESSVGSEGVGVDPGVLGRGELGENIAETSGQQLGQQMQYTPKLLSHRAIMPAFMPPPTPL